VGGSTLNNCIVYYNLSRQCDGNYCDGILNYSCTTPLATSGLGNFTNAPLFVDLAGGNLRLQPDSPCINAGLNTYASGLDLEGGARIVGGTVDVGAYEFQTPTSLLSYAWLLQYSLPTDGSADAADSDGDGFDNYHEWRAGTDPTNALSVLRLLTPTTLGPNLAVTWESVAGRSYFLERSTNFTSGPTFIPLVRNVSGMEGSTTYIDLGAAAGGGQRYFYRVGVE